MIGLIFLRLKDFLTHKIFLFSMLSIPMVLFYVVDYASKNSDPKIKMVILDQDKTDYSKELIGELSQKKGFSVKEYKDERQCKKLLRNFKIDGLTIILPGYKNSLLNNNITSKIKFLPSKKSEVNSYVTEVISTSVINKVVKISTKNEIMRIYRQNNKRPKDFNINNLDNYMQSFLENGAKLSVSYQEIGEKSKLEKSSFYPTKIGIYSMFIVLFALFAAGFVFNDFKKGFKSRILAHSKGIYLNFYSFYFSLIIMGTSFILLYSYFGDILHGFSKNQLLIIYIILILILYCIYVCSGAIFVILIFKRQTIQPMAVILTLFSSIIGGCFFNINLAGSNFKKLALFVPQGQIMFLANNLRLYKVSLSNLSKEFVLIITLWLLAIWFFIFSSYFLYKRKLQE